MWISILSRAEMDKLDQANQEIFGHESFRSIQRNVVEASMEGKDIFVLMPTGGGKSLCYQLPAVLSPGVTIVVSPLLSLIQDQVFSLVQNEPMGIPAAFLSSTVSKPLYQSIMDDLKRYTPNLKMLYVTPEKLSKSNQLIDVLFALYERVRTLLSPVTIGLTFLETSGTFCYR